MRKMYIQPKSEIAQVEPMTIMGLSSGEGGVTSEMGGGPGKTTGDAPRRRRTPVF